MDFLHLYSKQIGSQQANLNEGKVLKMVVSIHGKGQDKG